MAMQKIKRDDIVKVIAGRDKGRTGKVIKRLLNGRLIVEGVNMVKKHVRPNPQKNEQGGILDRESGIHVSNVALVNPVSHKVDRVGFKRLENGQKVRYFKSNDEQVDI